MDARLTRAGVALALAGASCVSLACAQQSPDNAAPVQPEPSAAPPIVSAPPPPPIVIPQTPTNETAPSPRPEPEVKPVLSKPEPPGPPPPPPGPPPPVRSSTAILRVLDKVTAETLRFEAPVGRRVRYKTLIFMVKACETRGLKDPQPRPSAYVVIDSQPPAAPGSAPPPAREIFHGWMFANAPGLHLFEHPVYDAWLESCTSAIPPG